jgi:hypothetical protein
VSCCGPSLQTAPLTERHRFRVRYSGGRPIVVKGSHTGTAYRFSGLDRLQLVDPRDAIAMLRAGSFELNGVVEV